MKKTPTTITVDSTLVAIPDIRITTGPKEDWDESITIGKKPVRLPDGRPLIIDAWLEDGYAFNTYLFPKLYLEQSRTRDLLRYLRSQGLDTPGNSAGVCDFVDKNGTPCWSVTVALALRSDFSGLRKQ